ncbi:MAG: CTP synthase [Endomicrobium sp.]|nr:CTP synthase [Endomicrobium sp.]
MSKYIFITGGVISSLGKGVSSASIGKLLQLHGISVNIIKFDPYINVDPGTMNPYQHGEVFVTNDGIEADLDLGTYERFLDVETSKLNTNTAGDIYQTVINKERKGEYNGDTVQIIPHITDEIKRRFTVFKNEYDVSIIEIGGTVGDIESLPFIEAVRQFQFENEKNNIFNIHITLIPYIKSSYELKTKPTQHSVNKLREIGLCPDMLICRSEYSIDKSIKQKISKFCNVRENYIIEALNESSIYNIPEKFYKQKVDFLIINNLNLNKRKEIDTNWFKKINFYNLRKRIRTIKKIRIAIIGKYSKFQDAYKSINESLNLASIEEINTELEICYLESENNNLISLINNFDGIIVPGGFGNRGIEGKIKAINYSREHKIPFLGICLGMQCAIIEIARNLAKLKNANSTEFDKNTKYPVIKILDGQKNIKYVGGTMRLGHYESEIIKKTLAFNIYNKIKISERHRHRYEMNPEFITRLEKEGLFVSAYHKKVLPEIIEIRNHPFFLGVQFHPEFITRLEKVHPIFKEFVKAAIKFSSIKK